MTNKNQLITQNYPNDSFVQDIVNRESNNYSATVVAHTINPMTYSDNKSDRLITLQLSYPRFIHSEMMTHKRFSRNAASSRARPVAKEIERIIGNPAMPIFWGLNQSGMQAKEEIQTSSGCKDIKKTLEESWLRSMYNAINTVEYMEAIGEANGNGKPHKQTLNRLLEPYQIMEAVFTGNLEAWQAFMDLRLHPDAQPEIMYLANKIMEAINESEGKLEYFHLPYVYDNEKSLYTTDSLFQISSARCARVSYRLFDGTVNVEKDIELAGKLLNIETPHASPAEHCARAKNKSDNFANFKGWENYRTILSI